MKDLEKLVDTGVPLRKSLAMGLGEQKLGAKGAKKKQAPKRKSGSPKPMRSSVKRGTSSY